MATIKDYRDFILEQLNLLDNITCKSMMGEYLLYYNGLYILDEPEAALSSQRQMSLLCLIDKFAKEESQFIIATHSPILISYRNGKILNLNNNFKEVKYEDTDIYNLYKMYLDQPYAMQHRMFDD